MPGTLLGQNAKTHACAAKKHALCLGQVDLPGTVHCCSENARWAGWLSFRLLRPFRPVESLVVSIGVGFRLWNCWLIPIHHYSDGVIYFRVSNCCYATVYTH